MARTIAGDRQIIRTSRNCLSFTTTNRVQVKAGGILSGAVNATISAWINPSTYSQSTSGGAIYTERNASSGNDIFKFAYSDLTQVTFLKFQYRDDAGTLNGIYSTVGIVNVNKWYHVALVKSGTGIKFYIDSLLAGTGTLTANDTLTNSVVSQIGNDPRDGNSSFLGLIDDVQVSNTNLTQAQVQTIFYVETTGPSALGRWKFDEGSGTAAIDSTGTQSNGTITGATYTTSAFMTSRTTAGNRFVANNSPTSLNFNGLTSFVSIPNGTSINITSSYSVSAWIYPFTAGEGNGGRMIHRATGMAFIMNLGILILANNASSLTSPGGVLTLNNWQHVAGVYDDPNNQVSFYVNAVLVGTVAQATNPASSSSILYLGNQAANDRTFNGCLKNISIHASVLTPSDIADMCFRNIYGTTNLRALWEFNEATGTVATDSSGQGNTGGISNAIYSTNVPPHMGTRTVVV